MGDFIDADDVADAFSPAVFLEIYDDENTGDIAVVKLSASVALDISQAEAEIKGWLRTVYSIPLADPNTPDPLLKSAALMYVKALAFGRHPEVMRSSQAPELYKRATDLMQRVSKSMQRLAADDADTPANVGGETVSDSNKDRANNTFIRFFVNGTGLF